MLIRKNTPGNIARQKIIQVDENEQKQEGKNTHTHTINSLIILTEIIALLALIVAILLFTLS